MESKSEEEEIIQCSLTRRVAFLMDDNGNIVQKIFGNHYDREDFIRGHNKMKLTYTHSQYNGARLEEIRQQFDKLTKTGTKEEIKEWLSPLKKQEIQRAGLILHDGNFQPWFFGKITRRESESYLKDQVNGTFLVRLSEKTASYTLSVKNGVGDCRHFLIISDPEFNDYKLLGSLQSNFNSVTSLIHHHGHASSAITKSGNEFLLHPCPKPSNFTMLF